MRADGKKEKWKGIKMSAKKCEDYMAEVFRCNQEQLKRHDTEELLLDDLVGWKRICPSCGFQKKGDYRKWMVGATARSAVCVDCHKRFCRLRDDLQEQQRLLVGSISEKHLPKFICPSCKKEYPVIVNGKMVMKNWRDDPEEGWMCVSCQKSKNASWNIDGISVRNELAVPAIWKINGHYLRVARMRLQEAAKRELDVIVTIEDLADEANISKGKWYKLENGQTVTVTRIDLELIKKAFRTFGWRAEDLLRKQPV